MEKFMNYDFKIENIQIAVYVGPGQGKSVHKNRAFHGLAIYRSPDCDSIKKFVFSENKVIKVGQNEIVYLPKGSNYTVSSKKAGECFAINFEISENVDFEPFSFKLKNSTVFLREFEKATDLWRNQNTAFHMQCKAILYNILAMMQKEYDSKYMTGSTTKLIAPAVEYIKKNYTREDIGVSALSGMCKIHEDYFRKIFKNTFGITPRKYINELKLSHAKELMKSGMYSVTEAAQLSGYNDMSYFSREFKKAFGSCPAEYKKRV